MIRYAVLVIALISPQINAETNIFEELEWLTKPISDLNAYKAEQLSSYITKQNNYQVEAKSYDYKGQNITFQHQLWKVKENSVCSTYPNNTQEKSKCQVTAKEFFKEVCQHLNKDKSKSNIQNRMQNMYCNAAVSFQPKIIQISAAREESAIEKARSECNALVLETMGNNDPRLREQKDKACNKYKALKENNDEQ